MFAYNGCLCFYYACIIAFKMQEQMIIKKIEPILHLTPFVVACLYTIPPLFFYGYWATGTDGWCTIAPGDSDINDESRKRFLHVYQTAVIVMIVALD